MRRILITALFLAHPLTSIEAAEEVVRLEGIAHTEGATNEIQIQVWALGDQITGARSVVPQLSIGHDHRQEDRCLKMC